MTNSIWNMAVKKIRKRRRWIWISLGVLILALIIFRLLLPGIVLRWVNRELTKIPGYEGHVDDIDIALIRGAYKIKGIELNKTGGKIPVPFFAADIIDLSVEWRALFHGRIVGKIIVEHPTLNFVSGPTEATKQTKISHDWIDVVDDLMPLKLNRFEIFDGEIHYRDFHSSPKVNIYCKNVHILAQNLSNVNKDKELLPSTADASADVYGGHATLNMKLDALNRTPTFDAKAEMVGLDITNLNNFIDAYANLDVKQGTISIYTEAAAKNGKIIGYTKPIIKDLKVVNWEKDKDKPLKIIWEAIVGAVAWVFKNHEKDQIATKAVFEGSLKDPKVDVWYLIGQILYNAFVQALFPALENSVNIHDLDKKAPDTPLKREYEQSKKSYNSKKQKK
ncbi:MAG: hypothetical protein C5B52_04450 [Bacteroidetes bacterium]|nr:MAG: hypothetical protein C5B52_04450 [Bacteroidota bacterium]